MCISRLCQYVFLSSFLCAPPIAPSLSFFPAPIVLPLPLRVCVRVPVKCSLLLHSSLVHLCSRFLCEEGADTQKVYVLEVACASERWLTSQTRLWHNDLRTWQAYIPPNDSPLWHNAGRMMSLAVKLTSLTERQHKYSH